MLVAQYAPSELRKERALATPANAPVRPSGGRTSRARTSGPAVPSGPALMRLCSQHWLAVCRQMPLHGRRLLDRLESDPAKGIHDFRRLVRTHLGAVVDRDMTERQLAETASTSPLRTVRKELRRRAGKQRGKAAGMVEQVLDTRPKAVSTHLAEAMVAHAPRRIRLV